ncbi:hypothetical protein KI387_023073, partial [Taxus chinensis]
MCLHAEVIDQGGNAVTLQEVIRLLMLDYARQQFLHGMHDYGIKILEWSHNVSGD